MRPVARAREDVGRLPAVHADPDGLDEPFALEVGNGPLPSIVVGPRVGPDVELLQVEARDAQRGQALLGRRPDVIGGEDARRADSRPVPATAPVLRRDLRGDERRLVRSAARAPRRSAPRCGRCRRRGPCRRSCSRARSTASQRGHRGLVVRPAPPAHAPGADADLGHRRSHSSEWSVHHSVILPGVWPAASAGPGTPVHSEGQRGTPQRRAAPRPPRSPLPGNRCGGRAQQRRINSVASDVCESRAVSRSGQADSRLDNTCVCNYLGGASPDNKKGGARRRLPNPKTRIRNPDNRITG